MYRMRWLAALGASLFPRAGVVAHGWQNLEGGPEYKPYINAEHETMVSIGVPRTGGQSDRGVVAMRFVLAFALSLAAATAFAHAFLERASPPVGGTVDASPPEISITFTEGIEPLFSAIELRDPHGGMVATGKPHIAANSDRRLVVSLPKLVPGTYDVFWHVTSVDTHKAEGSYKFTVAH